MNESETVPGASVERTEDPTRRLFYAWVGAMATALDVAEDNYERFVQRGREATQEWQARSGEARRQASGSSARVRDSFRMAMDGFLSTVDLPTKAEVDAMNVKLNILMRKLDELAAQQTVAHPGQPEAPATAPAPDTDLAT